MPARKSALVKINNGLDKIPRPEGHLFTIEAVAMFVHRSQWTIRHLLSKRSELFDPPIYEQVYIARGDRRLYRVLSEHDMRAIRAAFPVRINVYVKRKVRPRP